MYFHDSLGSALRRGFTLVEILVVLILMGLMASLVAPSIIGTRESDPASQLRELMRSASSIVIERSGGRRVIRLETARAERVPSPNPPSDSLR